MFATIKYDFGFTGTFIYFYHNPSENGSIDIGKYSNKIHFSKAFLQHSILIVFGSCRTHGSHWHSKQTHALIFVHLKFSIERLNIDRGLSVRIHHLCCFIQTKTFNWFNSTKTIVGGQWTCIMNLSALQYMPRFWQVDCLPFSTHVQINRHTHAHTQIQRKLHFWCLNPKQSLICSSW